MTARRFPPPWSLHEANAACFILTGRHWPMSISRTSQDGRAAAKLLTLRETRRIAANIAKLQSYCGDKAAR